MVKLKSTQLALVGLLTFASLTQEAQALPMFSAQTGMDCTGCHTQIMPRLNKFGRKFVASGMTMSKQLADMNTSSDMDINPSVLLKSRYAKTWDKPDGHGVVQEDGTNDGEFSAIRMAGLYLGGRLADNVGGMLNLSWREEHSTSVYGKVVNANEIEDGYWGIAAYTTPEYGPFAGLESYSTGLFKPLRYFDMRLYSNTYQMGGRESPQGSTGLQLYYDKDNLFDGGDHFFVTAGIYTPTQDNALMDMGDNILPFARIAYEHPIGDYNVMIGAFIASGGDTVASSEPLSMKRKMYGIDMQIEGTVMDKEATLSLMNVFKNDIQFTGIGAQDEKETEDLENKGFSVEGAVSITDSVVAKAAYMTFNDLFDYQKHNKTDVKDLDYAINLGLDYGFNLINKDMKLSIEYAWMNPSLDEVENYQSFMATLTLPF